MGNSMRKRAKVMKVDGEIFRIKTPATVREVTADYPGYVLLDSEAVKHLGVRAKALEPSQMLRPKKTYFLVELPKLPPESKLPFRRVKSGIHLGAKERLEMLMLSRRTVSDVTVVRSGGGDGPGAVPGQTSVRLRIPRSQINKLMEESHDASEVAHKILGLYTDTAHAQPSQKQVSFAGEGGREPPVLWSRKGK